ncbi:NINE protein [Bacteroides faecis]|jgi:TM2 domain-containing membrane protein YozV/DNA-directed RNA polymerase subunit RPC12/RpoP|uniref:TM2 domain-containing protein n=1 Tax=Bacteroides faecis TaxID=674529 RepID=UPI000E44B6CB|nr:TM2 domain-containing protein [Bacteroides faecis]MCS2481807.1 NINE protein [Bacteroides faecis]RGO29572.1 NINE protein [Bacteroides faecis]
MQEEIKCPQCGGNKFSDRGNNTYKCMYCGTTFNVKKPDEPKHTNYSELESAAPKVTVNVNVGPNPQQPVQQQSVQQGYYPQHVSSKSKATAAILAIFLGGLGAHHFYLGKTGLGILYLIFCWTWIPAMIGLIEGIMYLCMSDESFNQKYH